MTEPLLLSQMMSSHLSSTLCNENIFISLKLWVLGSVPLKYQRYLLKIETTVDILFEHICKIHVDSNGQIIWPWKNLKDKCWDLFWTFFFSFRRKICRRLKEKSPFNLTDVLEKYLRYLSNLTFLWALTSMLLKWMKSWIMLDKPYHFLHICGQ